VTLCIVAKRYILQQKYFNKWIASALLGIRRCNFQPPTPTLSPQNCHHQNFKICMSGIAVVGMLTMAIPAEATVCRRMNDVHCAHVTHMQITWYCSYVIFSSQYFQHSTIGYLSSSCASCSIITHLAFRPYRHKHNILCPIMWILAWHGIHRFQY